MNIPSSSSSVARADVGPTSPLHRGVIGIGHLLFLVRDYLFPVLFLVLLCTTWPRLPFASVRGDWWMDLCGFVVAALGQGSRILATSSGHNIRRGGRKKHMSAETLIQGGFFAQSRNPLYLGNLLIFCGLTLIANSYGWYFIALPVMIGVYWAIVLAEEDFLARRFGEPYADYCRTVNRFLPKLTGMRAAFADCHFDWPRIVRKESHIACSWLSMAIGLLIWERWQRGELATRGIEGFDLVIVFTVLSVGYARIRWGGKSE